MLDRVTTGPKPALVEALGADVPHRAGGRPGAEPGHRRRVHGRRSRSSNRRPPPSRPAASCASPASVRRVRLGGPASTLATDAVLKNLVLFGSVNANRRHYYRAAKVLARADRSWLEQLVTRRVRPDDVDQALARTPDDIKVVMEFGQS